MEEYPEELRTPPVPLVALVGIPDLHAAISLYLHRESPPLNTLALPDFAKVPMIGGKERKPADARMPPPLGILKADWLSKHRTRMPAVLAVLFDRDQVYGDPAQWMQVCTHLDNIKGVIRGRNLKLVVAIVQPTTQSEVNEDRLTTLRKRAEVDSKSCIIFVTHEPSEMKRSMARLGSIMGELATTFYREEGRRVKLRIEKKTYSSLELSVRYNFKVAVYAEFRRDWVAALKFYETAYSLLQEVITNTTMELQPVERVVEMKAVAEQLHFKVSTLLLHSGKESEAVRWFREHVAWFKKMVGPPEGTFLHLAWFSKQFQVFAELLQNSLAITSQPAALAPGLSERELQPGFYYQAAAAYMVRRRRTFEAELAMFEEFEDGSVIDVLAGPHSEVGPPVYVGQASRLLKRGNDNRSQSPTGSEYMRHTILMEKGFHHSHVAIELLTKAHEHFKIMEAGRTIYLLGSEMGREYFAAKDYSNAKRLFGHVAGMYRKEAWVALLASALAYLRECARQLGLLQEYVEYSLELSTLPSIEGFLFGPELGPHAHLQKEMVQEEVLELLQGSTQVLSNEGDLALNVTDLQPVALEIDLVSPLRAVMSACVAFHNQTVKPGKATSLTIALLTHLPLPITLHEVEVLFNQPSCNFVLGRNRAVSTSEGSELLATDSSPSEQDVTRVSDFDLQLQPRKWKRITVEITAEESGKLECMAVVVRVGPHATIQCQVESPASREGIPLWMFESGLDILPLADGALAEFGQKVIRVEEPEALVDIVLEAPSPALVGEAFPVRVEIRPMGHHIRSGDLEVYFAPSTSGTLIPNQNLSSISTPSPVEAELLVPAVPASVDLVGDESYVKFTGLVEVPEVKLGESWSTVVFVRWRDAKAVTLMSTFVYQAAEGGHPGYQYRLHKSVFIECEEALSVGHRYMAPFRRDALLLGGLEANQPGKVTAAALALKESSILVVTFKNTSSLPLRLFSVGIEEADENKCVVRLSGGQGPAKLIKLGTDHLTEVRDKEGEMSINQFMGGIIVGADEVFTQLFWVQPLVASKALPVGTIFAKWQRGHNSMPSEVALSGTVESVAKSSFNAVTTRVQLSSILVESPPLVVTLDCPPHAVLGTAFTISIRVQNLTSTLQEIFFAVFDTTSFIFSGAHTDTVSILPRSTYSLSYRLVPVTSGMQQLPHVRLTSSWYSAGFQPSTVSTQLFVFPSAPNLNAIQTQLSPLKEA